MKHSIFITGAAGYVGGMLVEQFAKNPEVEKIIGLDKEPLPESLSKEPKLIYIQANTADKDSAWEEKARAYNPGVVIHCAWQIREIYGNRALSWKWNVDGSDRVFDFALNTSSVSRLIHFSTVASYGAFPINSVEHRYIENEPFRKTDYLYAEEKRIAEEHLENKYAESDKRVSVSVIRPASITGPRGRFMRTSFGLQSALSGRLKRSALNRIISGLVTFVPVTPSWLRQFIHEDDVVAIVERLALGASANGYEVFNICPPGEVVLGKDMAKAVGKRTVSIPPQLIRFAFFWAWHLTRGRVPTAPGVWKAYSYPIAIDGSKAARKLGYEYRYPSFDALYYTNGAYESGVPESLRRHK